MTPPPVALDAAAVRDALAAAFPFREFGEAKPPGRLSCRQLPEWVGAFGAVGCDGAWFLCLVPSLEGTEDGIAQAVLDVPEGRYVVDTYDTGQEAWVARESALASPLVVGVPRRHGTVILRIEPRTAEASGL